MNFSDLIKQTAAKTIVIADTSKAAQKAITEVIATRESKASRIKAKLHNEVAAKSCDVLRDVVELKSVKDRKMVVGKAGAKTKAQALPLPRIHSTICLDGRPVSVGALPTNLDPKKVDEMYRNVNSLLSTLGFRHITISKQGDI